MKKLVAPKFADETEDADWWYANRKAVEADFLATEQVALPLAEVKRARKLWGEEEDRLSDQSEDAQAILPEAICAIIGK